MYDGWTYRQIDEKKEEDMLKNQMQVRDITGIFAYFCHCTPSTEKKIFCRLRPAEAIPETECRRPKSDNFLFIKFSKKSAFSKLHTSFKSISL